MSDLPDDILHRAKAHAEGLTARRQEHDAQRRLKEAVDAFSGASEAYARDQYEALWRNESFDPEACALDLAALLAGAALALGDAAELLPGIDLDALARSHLPAYPTVAYETAAHLIRQARAGESVEAAMRQSLAHPVLCVVPTALVRLLRCLADQAGRPPEPPRRPVAGAGTGKGAKGKLVNERMLATIKKDPGSISWSAQEWADHLKCGKATVVESQTWKDTVRAARAIEKAERITRRRKLR
jgi:hypothetical protein